MVLFNILKRRRGVMMSEHSIFVALVAIVVLGSVVVFGQSIQSQFCDIQQNVTVATNSGSGCWMMRWGYGRGASYSITASPSISCAAYSSYCSPGSTSVDSQLLYQLNHMFPIKSVYALRSTDGQTLIDYEQAFQGLGLGLSSQHGVYNDKTNQAYQYEVLTQSGDIYVIFNNPQGAGLGFRSLITGKTYVYDHGQASYIGISNESGNL